MPHRRIIEKRRITRLMNPLPHPVRDPARRLASLWDSPHRPLFLMSFSYAVLIIAWWPLGIGFGVPTPLADPVLWHVHELLFGFALAAAGGYGLTALSGWTGTAPLRGVWLKSLAMSWLAARGAILASNGLPLAGLILINAAFGLLLAVILFRAWRVGPFRPRRKAPVFLALAILGSVAGQTAFLIAARSGHPDIALAVGRAGVLAFAGLIIAIGGRAIPAFIGNWLRSVGDGRRHVIDRPRARILALGLVGMALLGTTLDLRNPGFDRLIGATLLGAALSLVWAIIGWRPVVACRNPLLAGLVLGFLWVPIGLLAVAAHWIWPGVIPLGDAVHTLSIGAMAGLIMAIAGRASARRVDGALVAGRGFTCGIGLIWLATVSRLAVAFFPAFGSELVHGAAGLWCLGWLVFLVGFAPSVLGPAIRPVLSGARHPADPSDPLGGGQPE